MTGLPHCVPRSSAAAMIAMILMASAACLAGADQSPPRERPAAGSLWDRLDHDRFVERLGSLGLDRTLEALDRTEPAGDEVERMRRRLAEARLPISNVARDPAAIETAAATAVALRSSLLDAAAANHPDRGRWLADQAEDILLWIVPAGGADLAERFGTASSPQRALVRRWLPLADAASAEAIEVQEAAVRRVVASSDSRLGDALRRRLAEDLSRARLLRGITLSLGVDLLDGAGDPSARRRAAIELIESNLATAAPDLHELGRLQAATARTGLGEHRLAIRDLTALADDAAVSPRRRFEALAAIVWDTALREDPDNALQRLSSLRRRHLEEADTAAFALPWSDLEHRLLVDDAVGKGVERSLARAEAITPWLDLIERRPPLEREAMLDAALQRIRAVAALGATAPPVVLLAHAGDPDATDRSPEETRSLLERVLEVGGEPSVVRLVALRRLARLEIEARRWEQAVHSLRSLAIGYPSESEAPAAIDAAVELASSLAETTRSLDHETLARTTVTEALRTFPRHARADHWLLRQAAFEAADEQFEAAIETLARIRPDRPLARDGEVQSLEIATRAAESAEGRDVARWIDRAEAWLRRLEPWPSSPPAGRDRDEHGSLGVRVALARARLHLLADRPAAALVEVATTRESPALTREQMVEGVRIRLAAFDRLDRPEDAAEELRRLSAGGDAESGSLLEGRLEAAVAAIRRADAAGDLDRVGRIGSESAAPLAEALLAWLDARDATPPARAILLAAEGLRHAGRPTEANRTLDRLGDRYAGVREFALERAECLYAIGGFDELSDAMRFYRRIAASSPAESPAWWLAELRQLQILARVGRDVQRIPPRIERLRTRDAELGGEGLRRQFEALLLSTR